MEPVTRSFAGPIVSTFRAAVLIAGIVTLSACGAQGGPGSDSSPTGTSSAAPSSSPAHSGNDATTSPQAGRVRALTLTADDLPENWRNSSQPDPRFRMTICGVDVEPVAPVAEDRVRFSQTGLGLSLIHI